MSSARLLKADYLKRQGDAAVNDGAFRTAVERHAINNLLY